MNQLYLVRKGQRAVWVAAERDGLIYVYSPDTGRFHHSHPVTVDFFVEDELDYASLSVQQALEHIAAEVGKLDGRTMGHVLNEFRADAQALTPEQVLGVDTATTGPTRQVQTLAERVAAAAAGKWTTWQIYPPEQRQRAYVAASDLRAGRVASLARAVGAVETTVHRGTDGSYAVWVTRAGTDRDG